MQVLEDLADDVADGYFQNCTPRSTTTTSTYWYRGDFNLDCFYSADYGQYILGFENSSAVPDIATCEYTANQVGESISACPRPKVEPPELGCPITPIEGIIQT